LITDPVFWSEMERFFTVNVDGNPITFSGKRALSHSSFPCPN